MPTTQKGSPRACVDESREAGFAPILLILLAALGLILFILISSSASFTEGLFSLLYPKSVSKAGGGFIPVVFKSSEGEVLPVNAANIPLTQSADVKIELTSTLGSPVASSSASPIASPSASPTLTTPQATGESEVNNGTVVGTTSYRIAESSEELDEAQYEPYIEEPTVIDYTFDDSLGSKYIWVEFKDPQGKTDRKVAQIELLSAASPTPKLTQTPTSKPSPTKTPSPTPTPTPTPKPNPKLTPTLKPVPIPTPQKLSPKPSFSPLPPSQSGYTTYSQKSKAALLASPSPVTSDYQDLQTKDKNCGIFCGFGRLVEGINKVLEQGMEQILKRFGLLSDE